MMCDSEYEKGLAAERMCADAELMRVPPMNPMGDIGDINSLAKGSGARYNAGKAPLDLIPLRLVAESYRTPGELDVGGDWGDAIDALDALGWWQETGDSAHLYNVMRYMGLAGWVECAKVFDYGSRKYAAWNWSKGMAWSVPLGCAARHLMQILDGEDVDAESELPHRGHVFCNIVMLLTYARTYPEGDDRPRMLAQWEPQP